MRFWDYDPTTHQMRTRDMTHLADRTLTMSPYNAPMEIIDAWKGVVAHSGPLRKKVAIIGAGFGRDEAPYEDPEWEVWALNVCGAWDAYGRLRADRWFEIHELCAQSRDDYRWMHRCPFPLYVVPQVFDTSDDYERARDLIGIPDGMREDLFPTAVRLPLERLESAYGVYWSCTFAYQMALALLEGFEEVGLYGVELPYGTYRERTVEWACVSYWIGVLDAKGIKMHFPSKSMLGRHCARYGVEYRKEIDGVKGYLARIGQVEEMRKVIGMGD